MKNALEIHNFSQKLNARMVELGFYQKRKNTKKDALITLYNLLEPFDQLTYKDTPPRKYYYWLDGKAIPDKDTLVKLCNVLEVDFEYFFGETTPPTRDIGFISDTLKLSPKAIEKLMCYHSGLIKILDALICTESKYASPDNTGIFEALLHQMWQYSYMMQANNIEIRSDNLAPVHITDKEEKKQFFKKYPTEIFDSCLDIAEKIRREGD